MKRLEPINPRVQQRWIRRTNVAVREHTDRSLRRALALALTDHLEQVAATLRQSPDVNTYVVAAAGMARVLMVLSLGAHQLETPLPRKAIDAIPELDRWALNVREQARLADRNATTLPVRIVHSEPASHPPAGPEPGKRRGQV